MRILTLIPEAGTYGIAMLVLYALSSFSLAAQLHSHWLAVKRVDFMVVHSVLLGFTVVLGFFIFDPARIFGDSLVAWILSLPLGFGTGWIVGWSDRAIIRYLSRRQLVLGSRFLKGPSFRRTAPKANVPVRSNYLPLTDRPGKTLSVGNPSRHRHVRQSAEDFQLRFLPFVTVAVFEELVYRGLLVKVCFLLPGSLLIVAALLVSVVIFSFSHINFGWPQVLAKFPLGALAMIMVLITGTVLPAVVAHVVFNVEVWRNRRDQPVLIASI